MCTLVSAALPSASQTLAQTPAAPVKDTRRASSEKTNGKRNSQGRSFEEYAGN